MGGSLYEPRILVRDRSHSLQKFWTDLLLVVVDLGIRVAPLSRPITHGLLRLQRQTKAGGFEDGTKR